MLGKSLRRLLAPRLDEAQIVDALSQLPAGSRSLCVHSSLSACGVIAGGALTVIRALRLWHGAGILSMPAHSYCYPDAAGNPPVFDRSTTKSVVGAITDAFWREPGVARSLHPTHSLASEGDGTARLIEGHERCDTPCGAGTPYERLVRSDASILMFGATMHTYTLFHTAEDAAQVPYLYEPHPVPLAYRDTEGRTLTMKMRRHDVSVARSFEEKAAWLESRGLLHRMRLGAGELLFIPHAQAVHEAVVAELRRDPSFLRAA